MSTKNSLKTLPLFWGAALCALPAFAQQKALPNDAFNKAVSGIQSQWDKIQYQTPDKDDQIKALTALEAQSEQVTAAYPDRAEPKIWEGIVYSTDAGLSGGMSALPKVKKAKNLFEEALKIDDKAMNSGAYTSLGSLYYKVPGWPIAFGNDHAAEVNLKAALASSPDDIDANYFYGDFLIYKKQYAEAVPVLEKAMAAPPRPGREIADAGRRHEIQTDLTLAEKMRD